VDNDLTQQQMKRKQQALWEVEANSEAKDAEANGTRATNGEKERRDRDVPGRRSTSGQWARNDVSTTEQDHGNIKTEQNPAEDNWTRTYL
jgi:hypothetical protein